MNTNETDLDQFLSVQDDLYDMAGAVEDEMLETFFDPDNPPVSDDDLHAIHCEHNSIVTVGSIRTGFKWSCEDCGTIQR